MVLWFDIWNHKLFNNGFLPDWFSCSLMLYWIAFWLDWSINGAGGLDFLLQVRTSYSWNHTMEYWSSPLFKYVQSVGLGCRIIQYPNNWVLFSFKNLFLPRRGMNNTILSQFSYIKNVPGSLYLISFCWPLGQGLPCTIPLELFKFVPNVSIIG